MLVAAQSIADMSDARGCLGEVSNAASEHLRAEVVVRI